MEAAENRSPEATRSQEAWLDLLVSRGSLSASDAAQLAAIRGDTNQSLASIALRLGKVSEWMLAEAVAEAAGLQTIGPTEFPADPASPSFVQAVFWRTHELVPLEASADSLTIATWDTSSRRPIEALAFSTRLRIVEKVATRAAIVAALGTHYAEETTTE